MINYQDALQEIRITILERLRESFSRPETKLGEIRDLSRYNDE